MPPIPRRASWATWTERALAGDDHLRVRALFKAADSQLRDVNQKIKALERADIPTDEKRAQLDLLSRAQSPGGRGRPARPPRGHAKA